MAPEVGTKSALIAAAQFSIRALVVGVRVSPRYVSSGRDSCALAGDTLYPMSSRKLRGDVVSRTEASFEGLQSNRYLHIGGEYSHPLNVARGLLPGPVQKDWGYL